MHVIIFNLLIVIPRFYAMSDLMFGLPSAFFGTTIFTTFYRNGFLKQIVSNSFCPFERIFKIRKNHVFFVLEIFMFLFYSISVKSQLTSQTTYVF